MQPIYRNRTDINNSSMNNVGICYGNNADWHEYPYIVSIRYRNDLPCCTGTIISLNPGKILTAAHCDICNGLVKIGCTNPNKCNTNGYQNYIISRFNIHSDYDPNTYKNDIAIITLNRAINHPINAISINIPKEIQSTNQYLKIIGYGEQENSNIPSKLQYGIEQRISNSNCNRIMNNIGIYNAIYPEMICIQGISNNIFNRYERPTICSGDSGGPIVYEYTDNNGNIISEQYGINSWVLIGDNAPCNANCQCCTIYPQVGINVAKYYHWIQDRILS